ncbi:pyruvate ferredoxin oxidoreductase subunit gamma [Patescibacteria group bacterium]|nr:pyruvate ferredoxin oxidoreductase subunit gamma [Patescibacteria group bacterium]MBU1663054.1 pyruvate ferredoxin oxidoreductase subunit gamma [Patescibacteria group bacterium]MBU1933623.1 pyruvate ferredoxin oxidoreductase subunit gamma [Patescibacteria group bacterium]MBU2008092.1 pyruvate ferredoxin oxidoreductase subunit gamma [Patescibacteria group bacterium]MBU2233856.1 pyruvate ferredoxin oxidoreductase subunit gamma [Patescibacteria group bacterium]
MFQIRIHGRGGQGVVTAAELIAIAAFKNGKQAQAFPFFGVERTGAPVEAYARIDDRPIILRQQIYQPDVLIIQDPTLLDAIDITKGCTKKTIVIINTPKDKTNFSYLEKNLLKNNIHTIDASKIALEIIGKNIVNTLILGAFAKFTGLISLDSLKKAVREKFAGQTDLINKNIKAVETAYRIISK